MAQATVTIQTQATTTVYPTARPVVISGPINATITIGVDNNNNTTVNVVPTPVSEQFLPVSWQINVASNTSYIAPANVDVIVLTSQTITSNVILKLTGQSNSHICITTQLEIDNFTLTAVDANNNTLTVYGVPTTLLPTTPIAFLLVNNYYIRTAL